MALGVSGQQALAQDAANLGNVHVTLTDHWVPGETSDATAAVLAGPVGFVAPPPVEGPPASWPCFAPNAPCSSDPKGGMLIGLPLQQWPISGATNCTTEPCGQIMAMFETTTGTGAVSFTVTITQGATTIYTITGTQVETAKAHQVGVVDVTGVQFDATAKAGAATVTVTTTVGKTKVTGKTIIYLM
jgi:hypothetical protein